MPQNDEYNDNLTEIERLAPAIESLRDDEDRKLSQFLHEKIFDLKQLGPTGTWEQQTRALGRLTQLRQGPLGTFAVVASQKLLDIVIEEQVQALGCVTTVGRPGESQLKSSKRPLLMPPSSGTKSDHFYS